ncbi:MAG: membrane protein insertase YidC [Candidatus Riflebacteria bacterium]|nr:membrane protein insertase YidC [Candidatus Riflebacteria bacterium]
MLTGYRCGRDFWVKSEISSLLKNSFFVFFTAFFFFFVSSGFLCAEIASTPTSEIKNETPFSKSSTEGRKVYNVYRGNVEIADKDGDGLPDVQIETPKVRILLTSKTGDIAFYYLKGKNFEENLYPPIILDHGYNIATSGMLPFRVDFASGKTSLPTNDSYSFQLEDGPQGKIVVVATPNASPKGINILKRYFFSDFGYDFETEVIVTNVGDKEVLVGGEEIGALSYRFGPGIFLDPIVKPTFFALKPSVVTNFQTEADLLKAASVETFSGAGIKTNYFCALMDANTAVKIFAEPVEISTVDGKKTSAHGEVIQGNVVGLTLPPFSLKTKGVKPFKFNFYFGPKILDELAAVGREKVTDYGFLSTVLLRILQFFNGLFPNYGLSIIFLTIVVRMLLYPLTIKQTKSMVQVQKIQPMVQDLKDRYRDDTQKFNEEVLKLYQKHQVNPLGGCLPMLLQLPVLIALYNTINIAVELRKTPFLWMSDLSKPDPLLILPISIAALMYYQQGQTPNSDPQQQQMMAFMPMFMFVVTWYLPSGLLVYWFTSSIIGLFQQFQANKIMAASKEEKTSK